MEHGLLVCCEFRFASCIRRETTHQSMDVAQDPQIAHLVASKREDRRTVPPHVASGGRVAEHRLSMDAVEAQLARDCVVLLEEIEDVRRVAFQGVCHPSDVVRELIEADEDRTERAPEGEPRLKYFGD